MYKLFFAFLYFGLTSCVNQKAEPVNTNPTLHSVDSVGTPFKVQSKEEFTTTFAANVVTEMGKAINGIFQDSNGNYWLATNGEGVFYYDSLSLFQFTTKDGLSDNQVLTIQEDKEGNLWLLTISGICRFDGKTFTSFPAKNNQTFYAKPDLKIETDDLWFEVGGGAYRYHDDSFSYLLLPPSDDDPNHVNPTDPQHPDTRQLNAYSVYCSLKDKKGNLWLGTQTMGVCRYDGKSFTWLTEHGLSGPAIRAIFEDRNGNLWFGNNGHGLFRYDGNTLTNFTAERGLSNPEFLKTGKSGPATLARVWTVNEDNHGDLWIGTYDAGVWRYNGDRLIQYTTKDGLTSNAINTIYKDKRGELWFGTDGAGVCLFNGKTFSKFKIKN